MKMDEREFLHSLSAPVSAALLLFDDLIDRFSADASVLAKSTESLRQTRQALEQINERLTKRREYLRSQAP